MYNFSYITTLITKIVVTLITDVMDVEILVIFGL